MIWLFVITAISFYYAGKIVAKHQVRKMIDKKLKEIEP